MRATRIGGVVSMVLVAVTAMGAAACGGAAQTSSSLATRTASSAKTTGSCKAQSAAEPMTKTGQSATLALAKIAGRRVIFVADEDAKAILTLDADTRAALAETSLDGSPGQLWIATDGRLFVSLREKNELAVFSVARADAPLTKLCGTSTPAEPIAIAPTPDESTIVVTTGWGQKAVALDTSTLATRFEAKLPREPRSVVIADDGKTAFVSHAVGSLVSAIDLSKAEHRVTSLTMRGFQLGDIEILRDTEAQIADVRETEPGQAGLMEADFAESRATLSRGRPSCQGFALVKSSAVTGRIFAPQVMVDPGSFEDRPDGYGSEDAPTEVPAVAVIDEGARSALESSVSINADSMATSRGRRDARDDKPECLLPRAAAIDAKTKSLLVTCYGIDAVIAYDATAANPRLAERRRWTVGSGPSGVAVDAEKHRAVVWSQFDRTISTFPIGGMDLSDEKVVPSAIQKTALAPLRDKLPTEYALGRILFHAAGDARIASDGRACASCHPDGRDDAITWATPEGPRRTIMLAGRTTATAPYSWNGNETTLHNHLGNTFDRLSGKGLRSIELDALVTYLSRMPAPTRDAGADKAKIERGRFIFASKEAGCSSCHAGSNFTDGRNHDVGSKHKADREASFNTPSLHLVGGTGPYFHDGRYATLAELLKKSDGQMGRTKHLSEPDLDALEAYLRTL